MNHLRLETIAPGLAQLTLSQPARRNAMNAAMWAALPDVLSRIDETIKALIITGDGDHFCAGADISEFGSLYATPEDSAAISAKIAAAMDTLTAVPIPTIARIRGVCVGGGLGLALCCDVRIADNTARFAITPARLGLVYPFGDVARLIDAVGVPNAKDILFSARLIKAKRAAKMGLINRVVKGDDLDTNIMDYAQQIAEQSGESARVMKQMFARYAAGQREDDAETQAMFLSGFSSDDFEEGYTAFMEKRKPRF